MSDSTVPRIKLEKVFHMLRLIYQSPGEYTARDLAVELGDISERGIFRYVEDLKRRMGISIHSLWREGSELKGYVIEAGWLRVLLGDKSSRGERDMLRSLISAGAEQCPSGETQRYAKRCLKLLE